MGLLYLAAGPVVLTYGVRAWGVFARTARWTWFWLGLLLVTVGSDGLFLLHAEVARSPNHRMAWPLTGLVLLAVVLVVRRTWLRLGGQGAA